MNDGLISELKYAGNYHPKKVLESARRAVVDRIDRLEDELNASVIVNEKKERLESYEEEIKELKLVLSLYDRIINTLIVFCLIKK